MSKRFLRWVETWIEENIPPGANPDIESNEARAERLMEKLFAEAAAIGREVIWLHTYGERFIDPAAGRPHTAPRMPAGQRPTVAEYLDRFPELAGADSRVLSLVYEEFCLCEERDGSADVALMHVPFNSLAGFDSEELMTEGQFAVLPAGHPLAARKTLSLADISDVPGLPPARWPRHGVYPPGPGPEIHNQTQLAQLVALGRTVAVLPESARAWLWSEHAAVPLTDAPPVVTHIAWPAHSRSLALAGLVRTALQLSSSR